ncbi:hypothetical protein SAMN05428989_2961 [Pseudoxanthomonas sp. GM95]|uniref:hypothetical protein n=1 Tax=Pseudoxanthomonas sp. GM95 TaxID=1881043 RepID=UPI0008B1ABCA|nr:hypothetical protein [Pseudoxanthomonas sp. GM95]SEL95013.1 hypothetical protein SAMN05428989_2961 [Pseudoxanthomonas sp. GM95]
MKPSPFSTVPEMDALEFGYGPSFNARKVAEWMELDKKEVSRISAVAPASVRYDDHIPRAVRDRLEEIGSIANLVAQVFNGDVGKTALWFRASNPMLGDVSPRDMVRLGRHEKLRKSIRSAMASKVQLQTAP